MWGKSIAYIDDRHRFAELKRGMKVMDCLYGQG